jgi:hypothetical protein
MRLLSIKHPGCIAFLVLACLLSSCASREFISTYPPRTVWTVKLVFDPIVPEPLQDMITAEFKEFTYQSSGQPVKFVDASEEPDADMTIHVRMYKHVTAGQSAAGVFVTMLGFAAPVLMAAAGSPIVITFWYFPKTQSLSEIYVNHDSGVQGTRMHRVLGPGFLRTPERQAVLHSRAYRFFFIRMARHYEKELRKLK